MAIEVIPNQPISFSPELSENCLEFDVNSCYVAIEADSAYVQMKQTPCGYNLVEDGNFHYPYTPWVLDSGLVYSPESTGANFDDGKVCHIPGTVDDLTQTISNTFLIGEYYSVNVTITGLTAGSVDIIFAGVSVETITENGEYTFYINFILPPSGSDLVFTCSSEFDGCISYVSMYKLLSEDEINLYLFKDGVIDPVQPTFDVFLTKNFITVQWYWTNYTEGCYTIKVVDPCLNTYGSNIVPDPNFNSPASWTHTNLPGDDITFTNLVMTGGAMVMTVDNPTRIVSEYLGRTVNGLSNGLYKLTMDFGNINPNLIHGGGNVVSFKLGSTSQPISMGAVPANTSYSVMLNVTGLTGTADPVGIAFYRVNEGFCSGGESIEVVSVSFQPASPYYLESNCINMLPYTTTDYKLIDATCHQDIESLGFYWDGIFKLRQRMLFTRYAPTFPTDGKSYVFSSGRRQITGAQREKYYDVLIEDVSDVQHSALSTQIICDTLLVDAVEYFVDPSDYKPEWDKKKAYPLAEVRLQMMKQGTVIFNRNS